MSIPIHEKSTLLNSLAGIMTGILTYGHTAAQVQPQKPDHPNILMIVVDDLNDWIGVMNTHPNALTPNIDRLASRGTLFTNAHACAPLSGPTRAAILSGLRPSTTGVYGHNSLAILQANEYISKVTLLPRYFTDHGYKTLSTGKIFHEGSPKNAFEVVGQIKNDVGPIPPERIAFTPPKGLATSTDWGAYPEKDEEMPDWKNAQWAMDQLQLEHDRPFFMCVGFNRPHVPLFVPQKWFDMHPLEGIRLPHNTDGQLDALPETSRSFAELPQMPKMEWMKYEQRWEKSVQAYLACVTFVDHYIGMVLNALENSPFADNTVILLYGDHGYHVGEKGIWAKHTLWERSTRIPLIIVRPQDTKAKQTHKPVNQIDFYPTLLDLAGLTPNRDNEGKSLVPLLDDPDAEGFEASLTTHGYGNHSVRTERWRLIHYYDGTEELYDHWNDPNEWENLTGMDQYKKVLTELRQYLPEKNAAWDPKTVAGTDYNQFFRELFEKTRANK